MKTISLALFTICLLFFFSPAECQSLKGAKITKGQFNWDKEVLNKALQADPVRWKNDSVVNTEYTAYMVLNSGKALNYLALVAFHDQKNEHPDVSAKVVEQLRYVISGGKEPCCRGVIAGWADNPLAQSIALAKYTKTVWGKLSSAERKKLDLLMSCLAIAGNYSHNSQNHIAKGLYQTFPWAKGWNPNHVEGYVGVMIAAYIYFGGAEPVNTIFKNFSYDEYMKKLDENGFTNIKSCWEASGKKLMEEGGTDKGGGTTKGVKMPFVYSSLSGYGELQYDPWFLFRDLAMRMYKHKVQSTSCDGEAYIIDGTKTPYEGKDGMCYEFITVDASGCRSSASYCFEGWWNDVLTGATMQSFGLIPKGPEKQELVSRRTVGSEDLIYKLQHGYRGHQNGKSSNVYDKNEIKLGYDYIKDVYQKVLEKSPL
jgi:hypothetical protein